MGPAVRFSLVKVMVAVLMHQGWERPKNIEFNMLLYIQVWGECPGLIQYCGSFATLWIMNIPLVEGPRRGLGIVWMFFDV